MPESFAPSIILYGQTYTPAGWMWVLSFALAGVEWALKEVDTQEFKATVQSWCVENKCQSLRRQVADCEQRLVELRQELHIRQGQLAKYVDV